MGEPTAEVLVAMFGDGTRAAAARARLAALEADGAVALLEALVVSRDPDGGVAWDASGRGTGHIGARADTVATMLGVLLSPRAVVTGLAAACAPGAEGREAGRAFAERFAREVGPALPPGGSLVVAVVEDRWRPELERGLRGYHRLARDLP
jgi:uncharacterized membrane protein